MTNMYENENLTLFVIQHGHGGFFLSNLQIFDDLDKHNSTYAIIYLSK